MSQTAQTYDVFLSYNSRDHAAIQRVGRWLKEQGLSCFLDRWYLVPGKPWPRALEQALDQSNAAAIFLGPGEMGRWQQREQYLALDRQATKQLPVIPVLLPGSDPALGFLSLNTWVDLRSGLDGERQLRTLAAAIRGEPPGDLEEEFRATLASVCPYRGLLPFREEDAPFFFGREDYTEQLVQVIGKHSFVMVVGASGSGKSSVVRAGLMPRLRSTEGDAVWEVATMMPTDRPLNSLINALSPLLWPDIQDDVDRREKANEKTLSLEKKTLSLRDLVEIVLSKQAGTDRILLVVDQWEELYTLCAKTELVRDFVDQLLDATETTPLTVVGTCRGDFYGRVAEYRPLVDRMQDAQLTLGPMNEDELGRVIEEPAHKVGLEFEPGLARRIFDDVGKEPGRLPLLSFLLEQLWEQSRGGTLTYEAYEGIGGVQGGIARKAEAVFASLSENEKELLPRIFIQLVSVADESGDTRRRATLKTLGNEARPVITKLTDTRLLVTSSAEASSDETVEVAHEALIRNWKRSQGWVNNARGFLVWRKRLEPFVDEWRNDNSALLRGGLLAEAERWLSERRQDLDETECQFIEASVCQQQREQQAIEAKRRLSRRAVYALFAALLAGTLGAVAWWQRGIAKNEAERAERGTYNAQLLRLQYMWRSDPALAMSLLNDTTWCPAELKDFTWRRLYRLANRNRQTLTGHKNRVWSVAFSPDGKTLASASDDKTIKLWDAETGSERQTLTGHQSAVFSVAFSPDGKTLASASYDKTIKLWDAETGSERQTLTGHQNRVCSVTFSPDGKTLASASDDKTIKLWDAEAGSKPQTLTGHKNRVWSVAFSPDGKTLASASYDKTIKLWDAETGSERQTLTGHQNRVCSVTFSPDGKTLASASGDKTIKLW